MPEPEYLPCRLAIDGEPIASDTVLYEAGANILTLVSASASLTLSCTRPTTASIRWRSSAS